MQPLESSLKNRFGLQSSAWCKSKSLEMEFLFSMIMQLLLSA